MSDILASINETIVSASLLTEDLDSLEQRVKAQLAHLDEWFARSRYLDLYSKRWDFWLSVMLDEKDPDWFEVCKENCALLSERWEYLDSVLR